MTTEDPVHVPIGASDADMHDYVAVFSAGEPPPGEYEFTAIADDHAKGLMHARYPEHKWTLYRVSQGQRQRVCTYPEKPGGREQWKR